MNRSARSEPSPASAPRAARARRRRSRPVVIGCAALALLVIALVAALPWSSARMSEQNLRAARQSPSRAHLLGTDELGRDVLARMLFGGVISLSLGLLAAAVAVVIGVSYGLVAGYLGGRWDALMMRAVDVLYALPTTLLVMLFTVSLGARLERWSGGGAHWARFAVLVLAIGGVSWLTMARVVRGQVLSLRERPFVEAARALGLPTWRILFVHMLPNLIGPIVVFATLAAPQAILQESFLSFLGIGIQPPQATWGSLAAEGIRLLNPYQMNWWLVLPPCAALLVTLLSLNLIGDGLRDALSGRSAALR